MVSQSLWIAGKARDIVWLKITKQLRGNPAARRLPYSLQRLIAAMDLGGEADPTGGPSAAFAHRS